MPWNIDRDSQLWCARCEAALAPAAWMVPGIAVGHQMRGHDPVVLEWTDPPRRPEADDATQTADVFHGSAWPVLGVTSLERSLDFYCGVLGCRLAGGEAPHGGGGRRALLTTEGRPLT